MSMGVGALVPVDLVYKWYYESVTTVNKCLWISNTFDNTFKNTFKYV